jgi:hypothetical protein
MKKVGRLVTSNFPTNFKCGTATSAENLKGSSAVDLGLKDQTYSRLGVIKDIFSSQRVQHLEV